MPVGDIKSLSRLRPRSLSNLGRDFISPTGNFPNCRFFEKFGYWHENMSYVQSDCLDRIQHTLLHSTEKNFIERKMFDVFLEPPVLIVYKPI
jgi:hypothetical protein